MKRTKESTDSKLVISACLAGEACRYDGRDNLVPELRALVEDGKAVTICPEYLGGLEIPRKPCEIRVVKGERKVYNVKNEDLTNAFKKGAEKALSLARNAGARLAVLKAKSPSCGCGCVYDGSFHKRLVPGNGITAELFLQNGLTVMTEQEWLTQKFKEESIMEKKINLGIVFGGQSGEHEVSRASACNVIEVIDKEKYDITLIGITKNGDWKVYTGDYKNIKDGSWEQDTDKIHADFSIFHDPIIQDVDVFFPVLHGPMGEDGTIQGLFELMNKPYVGCGVLASAAGMDKVASKMLFESAGIPVGPYVYFKRRDWEKDPDRIIDDIAGRGFPVFIKPSNMGSSVGISKAHNREEFIDGVNEALRYDHKIVVEGFLNAREIECAVLEENGEIKAAIPGEVVASKEFYDYEAKYSDNQDSKIVIPAQISDALLEKIREYAIKAFEVIDGSSLSRVDFFVTRATYNIYINEINTMPGFTNISMYPKMWENMGVSYAELVEKLIQGAAVKRVNR